MSEYPNRVPRRYVTGEDPSSVMGMIKKLSFSVRSMAQEYGVCTARAESFEGMVHVTRHSDFENVLVSGTKKANFLVRWGANNNDFYPDYVRAVLYRKFKTFHKRILKIGYTEDGQYYEWNTAEAVQSASDPKALIVWFRVNRGMYWSKLQAFARILYSGGGVLESYNLVPSIMQIDFFKNYMLYMEDTGSTNTGGEQTLTVLKDGKRLFALGPYAREFNGDVWNGWWFATSVVPKLNTQGIQAVLTYGVNANDSEGDLYYWLLLLGYDGKVIYLESLFDSVGGNERVYTTHFCEEYSVVMSYTKNTWTDYSHKCYVINILDIKYPKEYTFGVTHLGTDYLWDCVSIGIIKNYLYVQHTTTIGGQPTNVIIGVYDLSDNGKFVRQYNVTNVGETLYGNFYHAVGNAKI